MMTIRLLLSLLLAMSVASAMAGEVHIQPFGADFELTVAVKNGPFDAAVAVTEKHQSGAYVYRFDQTTFATSAYAWPIFVLTWKPKAPDRPVRGAGEYSMEIPVTLRSWEVSEVRVIKAWPFDGIGGSKLWEYERLTSPEDQWRKLMASMQLADHYGRRVRPTAGETRRAYNTAVNALVAVALGNDWVRTPLGFERWVREAFERDEAKRGSLLEALRDVDDLLWRDLKIIEEKLSDKKCEVLRKSFAELMQRREENRRVYRLDAPGFPELDRIRERMLKAACPAGTQAVAG